MIAMSDDDPILARRYGGAPYDIRAITASPPRADSVPDDIGRPTLLAPVGTPRHCFAAIAYSGHASGTALSEDERKLLAELAHNAQIAYIQVEGGMMRRRIAALERELGQLAAAAADGST
jgi:hypothetical protein